MPAVTQGKVLVTGANGYIAVWVVKYLLDQGFSVRGTVRKESYIPYLQNLFKDFADRIEFVIVPDITKEGAFDEAVKGCVAIEHIASPFHFRADDPQELIRPAIAGTRSVLFSALNHANDTVKRVVITSSCSAVLTEDPENVRLFSESDWNEKSLKDVEEKGWNARPADKYHTSKTLAERTAWQFIEENKGKVNFDVVALNPPYVFGPVLHDVKRGDELNMSMSLFYNTIVKFDKTPEELVSMSSSWVDVRDVADAHIRALQRAEAGGERIIICSGAWTWQDFVNAAHKIDPEIPAGNTSYDPTKPGTYKVTYITDKSKRVLGMEYRGIEETTRDILQQFRERGWY